ncbi:MAG: hypothetical protein ACRELY_23685, partial [Polyangiaceae bacterium]
MSAQKHAIASVMSVLLLGAVMNCGGAKNSSGFDDGDNTGDGGLGFGGDGGFGGGDGGKPAGDKCHVPPDGADDAPTCTTPAAPPNSFSPVLKW